jgi:glycosyltransferase involved in cell wall biosynthesis
VLRKLSAFVYLATQYNTVRKSDCILVLHPGHLDLPLAWIFARLSNKKLIFDSSISPYDTMFVGRTSIAARSSLKARIVKYIETQLLKLPDACIVDTKGMKQFLTNELGVSKQDISVIPLGADDTIYSPRSVRAHRTTRVLFFGLYNEMHGIDHIMKAIKILRRESTIHFTLIGNGHLAPSMRKYAQAHILKNVTFQGVIPEKELVKQLQRSDIVLGVFSRSPLFERVIANKVFAAIACKKALISADMPAMHEYFTHMKNIFFVEPERASDIVSAIQHLSEKNHTRERIAENGYNTFTKHFTNKVKGEMLMKAIQQ